MLLRLLLIVTVLLITSACSDELAPHTPLACEATTGSEGCASSEASALAPEQIQPINPTTPSQGRIDYIDGVTALYVSRNLTRAVELFEKSAKGGESRAHWMLGVMHSFGIGVTQSDAKAILFHTFGAIHGVPESHAALAYRYQHGIGVQQSCAKALPHARAVADAVAAAYSNDILPRVTATKLSDLPSATSNKRDRGLFGIANAIGLQATSPTTGRSQPTDEDMLQYHLFKAEKGDQTSTMYLAYANMFGFRGLKNQDGRKALSLLQSAAAANVAAAHGVMGQIYLQGITSADPAIPQDKKLAYEHFTKGAEKGDVASINGLGYMYANGVEGVVERDFEIALKHFERAAESSNAEALYNLALMHLNGKGGLKQNIPAALDLLMRANVGGSVLAAWQLGRLYERGLPGMPPAQCTTSLNFYRQLIDRGSWSRVLNTAREAFEEGDYFTSFVDYAQAAEVGFTAARWNLAYLVDEELVHLGTHDAALAEEGVIELKWMTSSSAPADVESSRAAIVLACMERAASEGDFEAHLKMGNMYFYGKGTEVQYRKAKEHYSTAANGGNAEARFNLGLLHHFGFVHAATGSSSASGSATDFHLAKRYYDLAVESNPHAYYAVRGVLLLMNFQWWWEHFSRTEGGISASILRGLLGWTESSVGSMMTTLSSAYSTLFFGLPWDDVVLGIALLAIFGLSLIRNFVVHR